MTVKIYIDERSNNCTKVRKLVQYLGLDVEWVPVDIFAGETRATQFLGHNPFGKLPFAEFPSGLAIGESNAIMLELGKGSPAVPDEGDLRAQLHQWLFWEGSAFTPPLAARRFQKRFMEKSDAEIDPTLLPRCQKALEQLDQHLAVHNYVIGDRLTIADISLYGYGHSAEEGGVPLEPYPTVSAWLARLEADFARGVIGSADKAN